MGDNHYSESLPAAHTNHCRGPIQITAGDPYETSRTVRITAVGGRPYKSLRGRPYKLLPAAHTNLCQPPIPYVLCIHILPTLR